MYTAVCFITILEDMVLTVRINVSGTLFYVQASTLQTIPGSLLSELDKGNQKFYDKENDWFYFDRDPVCFRHIVNAHRTGHLHVTSDVCPQEMREELRFWRVPVTMLAQCCWHWFYQKKEDMEALEMVMQRVSSTQISPGAVHPTTGETPGIQGVKNGVKPTKQASWKNKLWLFLEEPTSSLGAKVTFIPLCVIEIML